jgi:hypothetical protein
MRGAAVKNQPGGVFPWTAAVIVTAVLAVPSWADAVSLTPTKDNTLYEDGDGLLSNGAGQHIFAGRSGVTTNTARRAVMAFDVAGSVPAGATIDRATLTLHLSMAPFLATPQLFELHRVRSDWGEGVSDAPFQEGGGTTASSGDATWVHTFFNTQFWDADGGDFSTTVSATQSIGDILGFYAWGPTPQMQIDVQSWLDNPSNNFGWILLGNESQLQTARRFDSRQNPEPTFRPVLTVEFSDSTAGAGRVPNGGSVPGVPLTIDHADGDDIRLNWGSSCVAGDGDYEIYQGTLGDFTSHLPVTCSTAGATSITITPTLDRAYYLVVPRGATVEGSYGDSTSSRRPRSAQACLSQSIADCP